MDCKVIESPPKDINALARGTVSMRGNELPVSNNKPRVTSIRLTNILSDNSLDTPI